MAAASSPAPLSPCDLALSAALSSSNGAALSRLFSLRVVRRGEAPPPCGADGAPCLTLLCRRSDEASACDPEPLGAVLAAGGRAFFLQPSPREGAVHFIEDRLASCGGGGGGGGGGGAAASAAAAEAEVSSLLAHEGVHAVDALLHGLDLALAGPLACSEVRAAGAGECARAGPAGVDWLGSRRRCVRRTAERSAEMAFPGGAGAAAVDAVFSACYDTPLHARELARGGALAEAVSGRGSGGSGGALA